MTQPTPHTPQSDELDGTERLSARTIRIGDFLDLRNASAFVRMSRDLLRRNEHLIVAIEEGAFIDYAGMKALADLHTWQLQSNGAPRVVYAVEEDGVRSTLIEMGLSSWLPFYSSLEEAREALELH